MPVDDGNAIFVLRWYDEVGHKAGIIPGYQNASVVHYHLHLKMKESFDGYSNWQVLCPLHLTKMEGESLHCARTARYF